jgi:hypothetical protein
VTRALCLALALSSCAPAYAVATHRTPPLALFVADMVAFSAGSIVGLQEFNKLPQDPTRDETRMGVAFGAALASWLPYWVISTDGRP